MSIIDQALKANERYAKTYGCEVGERTTTAEDRGRDLHGSASFGPAGDSWTEASRHRRNPNRGPNATEDVLAELIVSTRVLGSKVIMLLNHTGCGFTAFTDAELNAKFSKLTGDATPAPMRFFPAKDPEQQTSSHCGALNCQWIRSNSRGISLEKTLVHDLASGRLSGRIVEVEGYPPGDAAGHAFRGKTPAIRRCFLDVAIANSTSPMARRSW